eukprot:6213568-Pleurochrysis_carterae.AAC.2
MYPSDQIELVSGGFQSSVAAAAAAAARRRIAAAPSTPQLAPRHGNIRSGTPAACRADARRTPPPTTPR